MLLPITSPHFRHLINPITSPPHSLMARAITLAAHFSPTPIFPKPWTDRMISHSVKGSSSFGNWVASGFGKGGDFNVFGGCTSNVVCNGGGSGSGGFGGGDRGFRKLSFKKKLKKKDKELELCVRILIEEGLPDDDNEILSISEMLRSNATEAMKLALEGLKDSKHKTRDTSINDVGRFETIELSLLLCNDEFIQTLNKEWRDEDHATDVLSMSQHIPELKLPILMLGDIVISVETAARQAEERGHSLLDEIRILLVHGLLHLLGFDHEISEEAEEEMEKEEELLLKNLGWKGKGLIKSAYDTENGSSLSKYPDSDGTLLNSKSQISLANTNAIREAMSRGVQVIIATGKARPGAMEVLRTVDLVGIDGILSESSPGVFLQGLLVYGQQGQEIFRRNLDPKFCREVFLYSLEHKIPLVAFAGDRCFTLFDHPRVDSLHSVYREPKAQVMPSVEKLLASTQVQKLIFLESPDRVTTTLRPYWSEATGDNASVVQALPDMLELVPLGTSKGNGVKLLIDHLGVTPNEIMAIGDGENDIEMLKLAALGVALSNASDKAKAAANVIGVSNDEDGVADAIYRYAF
ncbi:hypothetical protein KSS87_010719 [Heliosperma pusillum]|nr:hypothetical protein KSS87_010719 [Heliosperma pusillum]